VGQIGFSFDNGVGIGESDVTPNANSVIKAEVKGIAFAKFASAHETEFLQDHHRAAAGREYRNGTPR
jgi:hypothetical protein